ncbi:16906_t:CDS:1, partial [Racocetra persica]
NSSHISNERKFENLNHENTTNEQQYLEKCIKNPDLKKFVEKL